MSNATQGQLLKNPGQRELITYPDLIEEHAWARHKKELKSPMARVETRTCTDCGAKLRTHRTFKGTLASIIMDPPNETSQHFIIKDPGRSILKAVDEDTYYENLIEQLNSGKTQNGR